MRYLIPVFFIFFLTTAALAETPYSPTDAERARWTMADLNTWRIVLKAYKTDHGTYPVAASLDELRTLVEPVYVQHAPRNDAWGQPFRYIRIGDGSDYRLISAGSDGTFQGEAELTGGKAATYAEDAAADGASKFLFRSWEYR